MRPRRDPRAERIARLVPGGERRRFALAPIQAEPSGRPRRDPRARRLAATVAVAPRPRIDWQSTVRPQTVPSARTDGPAASSRPEIHVIADPAFLVLAVVDQPGGALSDHDLQLIAAARQIADADGGAVAVLAIGSTDGLAAAGADRAMALPADLANNALPEFRISAVAAAIAKLKPRHVLFGESPEGGADLARRLAVTWGERLFSGVEAIIGGRVSRRARGGKAEMLTGLPRLMSIAENAFLPHDGPPHEALAIPAPAFSVRRSSTRATRLPADPDSISLAEADFIISAGNGVADWTSFAELGQLLGATRGGSRVVCDEGHLPRDRQVGASGSVVTARCYLAFGISGAPQHLQGITEVKHVVAVNTDLHAEMIKRADLAIIADAQEVMPALIAYAKERRDG
jgi:electron transfer flavoprotein alpha subunit